MTVKVLNISSFNTCFVIWETKIYFRLKMTYSEIKNTVQRTYCCGSKTWISEACLEVEMMIMIKVSSVFAQARKIEDPGLCSHLVFKIRWIWHDYVLFLADSECPRHKYEEYIEYIELFHKFQVSQWAMDELCSEFFLWMNRRVLETVSRQTQCRTLFNPLDRRPA